MANGSRSAWWMFEWSGLRRVCLWSADPLELLYALRARIEKLMAVPAPRAGFFSLLVQRKETKRKHAPDGALILASAALGPALTRRDILSREPAAGILPAALRALAQSLAGLGCAIRGWKTPPSDGLSWVVDLPVVASRAPSKAEGSREPFERAQGAKMYDKTSERSEQGYIFAPGELGERPAVARRAGYRAKLAR